MIRQLTPGEVRRMSHGSVLVFVLKRSVMLTSGSAYELCLHDVTIKVREHALYEPLWQQLFQIMPQLACRRWKPWIRRNSRAVVVPENTYTSATNTSRSCNGPLSSPQGWWQRRDRNRDS